PIVRHVPHASPTEPVDDDDPSIRDRFLRIGVDHTAPENWRQLSTVWNRQQHTGVDRHAYEEDPQDPQLHESADTRSCSLRQPHRVELLVQVWAVLDRPAP